MARYQPLLKKEKLDVTMSDRKIIHTEIILIELPDLVIRSAEKKNSIAPPNSICSYYYICNNIAVE